MARTHEVPLPNPLLGALAREFVASEYRPRPCLICAEVTREEDATGVLLAREEGVAHEDCVREQERMYAVAPLAVEEVIRL